MVKTVNLSAKKPELGSIAEIRHTAAGVFLCCNTSARELAAAGIAVNNMPRDVRSLYAVFGYVRTQRDAVIFLEYRKKGSGRRWCSDQKSGYDIVLEIIEKLEHVNPAYKSAREQFEHLVSEIANK